MRSRRRSRLNCRDFGALAVKTWLSLGALGSWRARLDRRGPGLVKRLLLRLGIMI